MRARSIPLLGHSSVTPRAVLYGDPGTAGVQQQGMWAKQGKHMQESFLPSSYFKLLLPNLKCGDKQRRKTKRGREY